MQTKDQVSSGPRRKREKREARFFFLKIQVNAIKWVENTTIAEWAFLLRGKLLSTNNLPPYLPCKRDHGDLELTLYDCLELRLGWLSSGSFWHHLTVLGGKWL